MIQTLIDKQDTFEIVLDKIAQILADERASQLLLAADAGLDVSLWDFEVYVERSNPWEQFLNAEKDVKSIVNVWYESSNVDSRASNSVARQKVDASFNIDICGFGRSKRTDSGHSAGDEVAAKEAHRTIRLVRNILMSSIYARLDLRGVVWDRSIQSISVMQPEIDPSSAQKIVGARLSLSVSFSEFSPQYDGEDLCEIGVTLLHGDSGEVLAEADFIKN